MKSPQRKSSTIANDVPLAESPNPKTDVIVQQPRISWARRTSYNPIRSLTFPKLTQQLEGFAIGYIGDAARTWDAMENRDLLLKGVAAKRKKAVSRWAHEVHTIDDSPEAMKHKATLEYFYNNLSATNAFDENVHGGISLLIRQMLDCVGKRYAVHEIVWKPAVEGLTADFRFVPLWFFENVTGRLRYLKEPGMLEGVAMNPGEWLTCAGDGLMEASSVAYMFKHLPLKDWLVYCERHGMPGIRGKTSAPKGSEAWETMLTAVKNFASEFAAVMSTDETIEAIDLSTKGELPYEKLIEYLDRAIVSLWRGSDLSTMSSSPGGTGASVQHDETELLEEDDADLITECLWEQVDKFVIRYEYGADVRPLAYFKLSPRQSVDASKEILIDKGLVEMGVPLAISDIYSRYGRRQPEPGEEMLHAAPAPQLRPAFGNLLGNDRSLQGDHKTTKLIESAHRQLVSAQARTLLPIRQRLAELAAIEDPEAQKTAMVKFQKSMPALLKRINVHPETAKVLEDTIAAALLNGAAAHA